MARVEVDLKTRGTSKAVSDTKKVSKGFDGMATAAKGVAAAFVAVQALDFFKNLSARAGTIDTATRALDNLTGSAEISAEFINKMSDAVEGTIAKTDLLKASTKFLGLGLVSTADEAAKLAEIAVKLGASVSKGPTEAIDELGLLLANESILRLDSFNVSGAKVRETMAKMGKTTDDLTRSQKFLASFMKIATEEVKKQDDILDGVKGSTGRLSTSIQNLADTFTTEFSTAIIEGSDALTSLVNGISSIITPIKTFIKWAAILASVFWGPRLLIAGLRLVVALSSSVVSAFTFITRGSLSLGKALVGLAKGSRSLAFVWGNMKGLWDGLAIVLSTGQKAFLGLTGVLTATAIQLGFFNKKTSASLKLTNKMAESIDALNKKFPVHAKNITDVSEATKKAADELKEFNAAWIEFEAKAGEPADEASKALREMENRMQALKDSLPELEQAYQKALDKENAEKFKKTLDTIKSATESLALTFSGAFIDELFVDTKDQRKELTEDLQEATNQMDRLNLAGKANTAEFERAAERAEELRREISKLPTSAEKFENAWKEATRAVGKAIAKMIADAAAKFVASKVFTFFVDLILPGAGTAASFVAGTTGLEPIPAANGFNGVVKSPTLFLAGEGGQPEHVRITPQGQQSASGNVINININGGMIDETFVRDDLLPLINQIEVLG